MGRQDLVSCIWEYAKGGGHCCKCPSLTCMPHQNSMLVSRASCAQPYTAHCQNTLSTADCTMEVMRILPIAYAACDLEDAAFFSGNPSLMGRSLNNFPLFRLFHMVSPAVAMNSMPPMSVPASSM